MGLISAAAARSATVARPGPARCIVNEGDRPVQVGSHLHFADANPALRFDREVARGHRLDVPAGTSVRLEPGVSKTVELIALGGRGHVAGLQMRDADVDDVSPRTPPRAVPFGEPGSEVTEPQRASGMRMRISETTATDEDPAEEAGEEDR